MPRPSSQHSSCALEPSCSPPTGGEAAANSIWWSRAGRPLRFVEVKARQGDTDAALDSITAAKRSKLVRAAKAWLRAHPDAFDDIAFTVAVVDLAAEPWRVVWYDDAFDAG